MRIADDAAPALRFAPCGLHSRTLMYYTPLIVELLRSQPRLAFWAATLAQGVLWWVVPSLFYSSPTRSQRQVWSAAPAILAAACHCLQGSFGLTATKTWVRRLDCFAFMNIF